MEQSWPNLSSSSLLNTETPLFTAPSQSNLELGNIIWIKLETSGNRNIQGHSSVTYFLFCAIWSKHNICKFDKLICVSCAPKPNICVTYTNPCRSHLPWPLCLDTCCIILHVTLSHSRLTLLPLSLQLDMLLVWQLPPAPKLAVQQLVLALLVISAGKVAPKIY